MSLFVRWTRAFPRERQECSCRSPHRVGSYGTCLGRHGLHVELAPLRATSTVCTMAIRPTASTSSFHHPEQLPRCARWPDDPRPPRRAFTTQSNLHAQSTFRGLHVGHTNHGLHVELSPPRCARWPDDPRLPRRAFTTQSNLHGVHVGKTTHASTLSFHYSEQPPRCAEHSITQNSDRLSLKGTGAVECGFSNSVVETLRLQSFCVTLQNISNCWSDLSKKRQKKHMYHKL